jgi:hypothetical protein
MGERRADRREIHEADCEEEIAAQLGEQMAPRSFTILTGPKVPLIRQPGRSDERPVNESAVAYFAGILERVGILKPNLQRSELGQD